MKPAKQLLERVLILRCQIGDKDALAELIGLYHRPLRYFIGHLSDNAEIVDDLFQDTWVSVIGKISTLRNLETFPAWLYRIARNTVYQHFRRKKPFLELDDNTAVPDETQESAFSPADAAQIHECLKKLHPEHKEVLVLRFLEQMSYQQIANVVECNLNTVKSRIYYAKLALKRKMEESHGKAK
ncbi:MAG: RNA polymerase sigma factor [Candidatus Aminicenantales bacterium]